MRHPATHTHSRTPRPVARRLAWLALGLLAPRAVPFYNAVHRVWGPLALLVACTFWIDSAALFAGGLAWLTHIAVDRAAGFGLRTPEGFQRG